MKPELQFFSWSVYYFLTSNISMETILSYFLEVMYSLASAVMTSSLSRYPLCSARAVISALWVLELETHVTLHRGNFSHTNRPKDPQPHPRSWFKTSSSE